jgi:hypothetical protein
MTLINDKIDALFLEVRLQPNGRCENSITGGWFMKGESGEDSIPYQKRAAEKALLAQEWFAVHGPRNAPPIPLIPWEWDRMRYGGTGGLPVLVGFYARSLSFRNWGVHDHPPFKNFACGLMVSPDIRTRAGEDPLVVRRYPSRPLTGMTPGAYWAPRKECEEFWSEHRR